MCGAQNKRLSNLLFVREEEGGFEARPMVDLTAGITILRQEREIVKFDGAVPSRFSAIGNSGRGIIRGIETKCKRNTQALMQVYKLKLPRGAEKKENRVADRVIVCECRERAGERFNVLLTRRRRFMSLTPGWMDGWVLHMFDISHYAMQGNTADMICCYKNCETGGGEIKYPVQFSHCSIRRSILTGITATPVRSFHERPGMSQ